MSIQEYPFNGVTYKIGTEGLEHGRKGISGFILEIFRKTYSSLQPVPSILGTLLFGGSVDAAVPTYGLWAGPGWAGGERIPSEENGQINWGGKPCFNENVKTSDNPESCYSVVDAITKTHDWRYVRPLTGRAFLKRGTIIINGKFLTGKSRRLLQSIHMLRCAAVLGVAAYTKSTPHFSDFARLASERI